MTTYTDKQHQLFESIEENFRDDKVPCEIIEKINDYKNDPKICLTAVSFLPEVLGEQINTNITNLLQKSDPNQFYFPPESLHITIKNIRGLNYPPDYTDHDITNTIQVFDKIVNKHKTIKFQLRGLFETPNSLGIRAYCDETLKNLVLDLDKELNEIGTPDNKKYASSKIFFGNITICRYTTKPNSKFDDIINKFKKENFGELKIKKISLITTSTAVNPKKTKIIKQYYLK